MANRFFINGGVDNNWGSILNWSTTSGGVGGAAVPLATDDVFFDASSPNCTVNTSARVALTLNFTGYTNTITMTNQITVSGSVTLVAAMTIAGAGALIVNAAATLTSNGKTWPNALTLNGAVTYTLADNWVVGALMTFGNGTNTVTINGNQITASAGVTFASSSGSILGTTALLLNGTGTVTTSMTTGACRLPLTINTAGTITFSGTTFGYNTGTFTYTAGTVVASSTALLVTGANTTLALNGITWGAITLSGVATITLSSNLQASGLVTAGSGTSATVINGFTVTAPAGLRYGGSSGLVSGTTIFRLTGTGSVDAPSWTSGSIKNPITLAAGSGTLTVSSTFLIDFGVLTFESGTIITNNTWASGSSSGVIMSRVRTGM